MKLSVIVVARHLATLALGGVFVALALASASAGIAAGTRPDDRAGIRGPNAPLRKAIRPDDRPGARGAEVLRHLRLISASPPNRNGGFHWADAGLGASGTLVLAALVAAALGIRQQNRREAHG